MKKDIKKTDEEWSIFYDIWEYYKNYAVPESDEKYWKALRDEGAELVAKHKDHPLA
jgi:plasmid stabilization system protein ParE